MPCPLDDHAALPEQDLQVFKRVVDEDPSKRRRLQYLGLEIPTLDGVGQELIEANEALEVARAVFHEARDSVSAIEAHYSRRHTLYTEERDLLRDLGLTQNLFRVHDPDYSKGEGLETP